MWTEITSHLKQERARRDLAQAQEARIKYGDLTAQPAFSYMRSNIRKDITSNQGIARVYRKLEGIIVVCSL
jgi:hypothetical protein